MNTFFVSFVSFVLMFVAVIAAEDWPQFRGPTGQGLSTERGLPLEWSESTNVTWKVPVPGRGWSSPVVAGGRVWLTTALHRGATSGAGARADAINGASLRVLAFDAATGREVVNVEAFHPSSGSLANAKNSHASPTPIVEGD